MQESTRKQVVEGGSCYSASYQTRDDLPDFSTMHGPLIHQPGATAYEIFSSLWRDEIMQHLVTETNRYYKKKMAMVRRPETLPLRSRLRDWVDVILPEI